MSSKIIRLEAENIKRLSAVTIDPKGNVVVIGGKNGQGKSSVLDSIQYALGGATDDAMPVRKGEEKGKIVVDLGDIVVRRSFTAAGGTALVIKNADGVEQKSPQSILDGLTGKLTFDPLEFSRQKPAVQAEILRGLVGLDFTKHDQERQKVYDERTAVNRSVTSLKAQVQAMVKYEDVGETETDTSDILKKQQEAAEKNNQHADLVRAAKDAKLKVQIADDRIVDNQDAIKSYDDQINALMARKKDCESKLAEAKKYQEACVEASLVAEKTAKQSTPVDMAQFATALQTAEQNNRKVRSNQQRAAKVKEFKAESDKSDTLTSKLEKMDAEKRNKTNSVKYPIDGLSFDTAGGVTLNGIPFNQASSAEQLRVSVAIGLAINPKLRVLLIRDGSLLDTDSLAILAEMAAKADAQVWVERVGVGAETSVVIEDGAVKEEAK